MHAQKVSRRLILERQAGSEGFNVNREKTRSILPTTAPSAPPPPPAKKEQ